MNDDVLSSNDNLRYIDLTNYEGPDIFGDLDNSKKYIICKKNSKKFTKFKK